MSSLQDNHSLRDLHRRLHELHARARAGTLSPEDRPFYERARDDLARMLVFAQQLTRKPNQRFRQALRVQAGLPVVLARGTERWESTTVDVSIGGFATITTPGLHVGDAVEVTLRATAGETIAASARVVGIPEVPGGVRVSCAFEKLAPEVLERVTLAVFDHVLPCLPEL